MYLEDEVSRINELLKGLDGIKHIVIWGAAENTVRLFQHTVISNYNIKYIVDKNKSGQFFWGRQIQSPYDVDWCNVGAVVISSFFHENDIERELLDEYGYKGRIIKLNGTDTIVPFYEHISINDIEVGKKYKSIIERNIKFKSIHNGKRVFILCTGPSINKMDLTKLQNEYSIAVHGFYAHKDFNIINPTYYCAANITHDLSNIADYFFREIDKNVEKSKFIFCIRDKEVIEKNNLFVDKEVYYYELNRGNNNRLYEEFDMTKALMDIQTSPILCLQLAIYMGFSEIYLLGTEHDFLVSGKYAHFYKREGSYSEFDYSVSGEDDCITPFWKKLQETNAMWEQYKRIKKIADAMNIKIYNATVGGVLDIFERVNYDSLFS